MRFLTVKSIQCLHFLSFQLIGSYNYWNWAEIFGLWGRRSGGEACLYCNDISQYQKRNLKTGKNSTLICWVIRWQNMNLYMLGRVLKTLSGRWYDYWTNISSPNTPEWKAKMADLVARSCARESASVDTECLQKVFVKLQRFHSRISLVLPRNLT